MTHGTDGSGAANVRLTDGQADVSFRLEAPSMNFATHSFGTAYIGLTAKRALMYERTMLPHVRVDDDGTLLIAPEGDVVFVVAQGLTRVRLDSATLKEASPILARLIDMAVITAKARGQDIDNPFEVHSLETRPYFILLLGAIHSWAGMTQVATDVI